MSNQVDLVGDRRRADIEALLRDGKTLRFIATDRSGDQVIYEIEQEDVFERVALRLSLNWQSCIYEQIYETLDLLLDSEPFTDFKKFSIEKK